MIDVEYAVNEFHSAVSVFYWACLDLRGINLLRQVGAGKLSLFTNFVWGDTPDTGPIASPDANELDLTVDWRLNRGWSEKVWVRLRAARVNQDDDYPGSDDLFDFRIIVNYDFDLL